MTLCEEAMHYIRASVSSPPPPPPLGYLTLISTAQTLTCSVDIRRSLMNILGYSVDDLI